MDGNPIARPGAHSIRSRLVGIALGCACATAAPAMARPLTSDDAALGGVELAKPVTLPADGKFRTVLTIRNLAFSKGEAARALLWGVLSMKNNAATGSDLVKLRMSVNGTPEDHVFSQTIAAQSFASHPIPCNLLASGGQNYNLALQAAVTGNGSVTVGTGTFDIIALRPIANPP
jgi:hypothetical protein